MADNVTVSKAYLATLLRRAELHDSTDLVKISVAHYSTLIQDAYRLQCLIAGLVSGGVTEETLEVLINSQHNLPTPPRDGGTKLMTTARRFGWSEKTDEEESLMDARTHRFGTTRYGPCRCFQSTNPSTPASTVYQASGIEVGHFADRNRYYEENQGNRSLVLKDIPSSTSILDLTNAIQGGMISNIYINRHACTAHVSFVISEAANSFYELSRHYEIAVKGKSIRIAWDKQQRYVPGHVVNHILRNGATRNLVIRFINPCMTATSIREDLDHIHRLEVVKIEFKEGHAWIQLNSIQHAITAKQCMQSRLTYKRLRIEYFPDGCDKPVQSMNMPRKQRPPPVAAVKAKTMVCANMFETLSIGSYEDDSESDSEGF